MQLKNKAAHFFQVDKLFLHSLQFIIGMSALRALKSFTVFAVQTNAKSKCFDVLAGAKLTK